MSQSLRHPEIVNLARRSGAVTVDGLARHFGVSAQTIRKDLSDLADAGALTRVHGGAVLPSGTANIQYEARRALNHTAKTAIAQAIAATIPNDCTLFLNIGTTTEAVAAVLRDHTGLLLVTNNTNIATLFGDASGIEVILTGGKLRANDGGLVGHLATQTISQFRFDYAIIGCSALTQSGDLLDFELQEVEVSQAILRHSKQVILAADQTKFQRSAPARIASVAQVSGLFTDAPPPDRFHQACQTSGTEITVV